MFKTSYKLLLPVLFVALTSWRCQAAGDETSRSMSAMDFLNLATGNFASAQLAEHLRGWQETRHDGSADAEAFSALISLVRFQAETVAGSSAAFNVPAGEIMERAGYQRLIEDGFYRQPTPELAEAVLDALAAADPVVRRAALYAAAAVADEPSVRSRLIGMTRNEFTSEQRSEAVQALLALGHGHQPETLELCRRLEPSHPSVRQAQATAIFRLSRIAGGSPPPAIDPKKPVPTLVQAGIEFSAGFGLPLTDLQDEAARVLVCNLRGRNVVVDNGMTQGMTRLLKAGGTVLLIKPDDRAWPDAVIAWAAKNGVHLPVEHEKVEGAGRINYSDYRSFCDYPYHISEEQDSAAEFAWSRWAQETAAPVLSAAGRGALVLVQDNIAGGGTVILTTVNLAARQVYRQNFLRWIYGDALLARPAHYLINRYGMDPEMNTEHRVWARNWAAGSPRVLWLSDEPWKRGLIELRQRVDMDWVYVPYDAFPASAAAWMRGGSTGKGATGPGLMGQRALALIESELVNADALAMDVGGEMNLLWGRTLTHEMTSVMEWYTLPRYLRRSIGRRLREGMGLLFMSPPRRIKGPLGGQANLELASFIGPVLPFAGRAAAAEQARAEFVGSGRRVFCGLDLQHHKDLGRHRPAAPPPALQAPGVLGDVSLISMDEYVYAMLGKLVHWVSGKRQAPAILEFAAVPAEEGGVPAVRLTLEEPVTGSLEVILRNRYNETMALQPFLIEGREATVPLPSILPQSAYVIEAVLKNAEGQTLNFAAAWAEIKQAIAVTSIETDRGFHREGENIRLRIGLSGGLDGEAVIRVRDSYGRLVFSARQKLVPAVRDVEFTVPVDNPLARLWTAEVSIERDGTVLCRTLRPLGIALPPPPLDFDTEAVLPASPLAPVFRDKLGVNLIIGDPDRALRYNFNFSSGSWWQSIGSLTTAGATRQPSRRTPCFSDPEFRSRVLFDLAEKGPLLAALGINNYMIGDEVEQGPACWCSHCMFRFRRRLLDMYGDLDALNLEWGTEFAGWEDIVPDQAQDPQRPGARVDARLFQRWIFAEYCNFIEIAGGDYMPGFTSGQSASSAGSNSSLMSELSGWNCYYGVVEHIPAMMRRQQNRVIGSWYRPGYTFSEEHEAICRHWPWWHLFRGTTRMNLWYTAPGGSPAIHGDLRPFRAFVWLGEEMRELRGNGIGRLLLNARRDEGGAAVYRSERNQMVRAAVRELGGTVWEGGNDPSAAFLARLTECRAISEYQVERGDIGRRGLRLLYLPAIVSLSEKERDAIRSFVRQGGVLVADFAPGSRNRHGGAAGDEFSRELFGIATEEGTRQIEDASVSFAPETEESLFTRLRGLPGITVSSTGSSVKVTDGQPLASLADGTPAIIVKCTGKGMGVLLNFPFPPAIRTSHPFQARDWGGASRSRDLDNHYFALALAEDLARLAGLEPMAEIEAGQNELPPVDFGLFRDGRVIYAGLVAMGEGGMIDNEKTVNARIRFPQKFYFYNVRTGESLGETELISMPLTPGKAVVYAGMPFRINKLQLEPARAVLRRGELLEVRAFLEAEGEINWKHVFRLRVRRPDGSTEKAYSRTVLVENGQTLLRLPIALDAPGGEWEIELRDAATGITGKGVFQIYE